ncbi:MAG: DUF6383 domain-containing protein [Tannerella sp.]|jgi:hypothetical protein|nr:DUF6383 domain-containing protein [Tannerella sp.]
MKKLLLLFSSIVLVFINISAQKKYTYLQGQTSPFNGEFNELRYEGVDSISYIFYGNERFHTTSYKATLADESPGVYLAISSYILVKNSTDGLSDTLRYYDESSEVEGFDEYVKKYSDDGKLVFSSSTFPAQKNEDFDVEERKFVYDDERISQVITYRNRDGVKNVVINDTIKYDYELKPYLNSESVTYNTIYTKNDSILVFYFDDENVYRTIEYFGTTDQTITQYVFDAQNRLIKITHSEYLLPTLTSGADQGNKESDVVEYKYTNTGYEEYVNEIKTIEYKFQDDGYCTDIIYYTPNDATVFPPIYDVVAIEKFSYCKDGSPIVANPLIGQNAPKVYGTQGGIIVNTEKTLPVSIYTFSGGLVKKEIVSAGSQTIPLSKGFYIVTIGNMSYKVLVH